jgi:hypothetical protein
MGNGHVASNYRFGLLVGAVNNSTILNVGVIANGDGVHIPPYHGIEPDCTVGSHSHFANDNGIISQEAVGSKNRGKTPNRLDNGHSSRERPKLPNGGEISVCQDVIYAQQVLNLQPYGRNEEHY